eukprot:GHRR01037810.1.p1 GENE.GHRR01037810.1~~GHRR01037810.1.p1  ORF type:complete len:115 (+),score=20.99 GHRR01037810.1:128-472(+)
MACTTDQWQQDTQLDGLYTVKGAMSPLPPTCVFLYAQKNKKVQPCISSFSPCSWKSHGLQSRRRLKNGTKLLGLAWPMCSTLLQPGNVRDAAFTAEEAITCIAQTTRPSSVTGL